MSLANTCAKIPPSAMAGDELKYWIGFSRIPGIGKARISQLRGRFASLEDAWNAPAGELKQAGLDSRSLNAIVAMRPRISLDEEMEKLERYKVKALTCEDPSYPPRLREIYDYPPAVSYTHLTLPTNREV